jgi:hypothetical protein|nr:MAG TPA: hypothetical protein [Caudoviricetes sp.]
MNTLLVHLSTGAMKISDLERTTALFRYNDELGLIDIVVSKSTKEILTLSINWCKFTFYIDTKNKTTRDTNNFTDDERTMLDELSWLLSIDICSLVYK